MNIVFFYDMGSYMLLNIFFRVERFLIFDISVGFFVYLLMSF